MVLNLADKILIKSIFFLTTSENTSPEKSSQFKWEGAKPGANWTQYFFVNDSSGKVQWIFPANITYPTFISLQNSPHPISRWKRIQYRFLFSVGFKGQFSDGHFFVKDEESFPLYELIHSVPHESFAILTNTSGNFRKSVVALNQGKYTTHFIKLAHTHKATELVYNEVYALQILSQRRMRKIVHPFLSHTDGDHAIIISSVKPQRGTFSKELKPVHLEGLKDIYRTFSHSRSLQDLPYFRMLPEYIKSIESSTEEFKHSGNTKLAEAIEGLMNVYRDFSRSIPAEQEVWVSLTHGDFLPWNMYVTPRQVYLFDWEYMQESLPLLYDPLYFIYHSYLTYYSDQPHKVSDAVNAFFGQPVLKEIMDQFSTDPYTYHGLYLYIEIPYILHRELKKERQVDPKELKRFVSYWQYALEAYQAR